MIGADTTDRSTGPALTGDAKEIAGALLKLGATSYGGPAMMGIMQTELQQKRHWVSKEHFLEGLAVANMLPGATATQLAIFLGYARGGWWGGLVGGLCFVLPAFVIMLALTMIYVWVGVTPLARDALYGLAPVVIGLFAIAVYRLGRTATSSVSEIAIAVAAAAASFGAPLGIVAILLLGGAAGLGLFHARRGPAVATALVVGLAVVGVSWWSATSGSGTGGGAIPDRNSLMEIGTYFFKVGAFTIGGGFTMIAFIQEQVVGRFGWVTPREFIDGLALGQLTPGPVLMIAAYVGYKMAGVAGAAVSAAAAFLPSFVIMLAILPVLDRVRKLGWVKAVMKGMAPAVIGILAVSLIRLAPAALPDLVTLLMLAATIVALLRFRVDPFKLMLAGAVLGVVLGRVPGVRGFSLFELLTRWTTA
jgi:chromate transporter